MENIERRIQREVRAMTRREVITKALVGQLSWVQAAQVLGVTDRHMRRIRWAVAAQADLGRDHRDAVPAQARHLWRLLGAALLRAGHREARREGLLQLAAADAAGSGSGGEGAS